MLSLDNFSKSITSKYKDQDELELHKIEYDDRTILSIRTDGIMDATFSISPPSKAPSNILSMDGTMEDFGIDPVILVGDHSNLKTQVVATEIGKLVYRISPLKNLILTLGSNWFGKGDVTETQDFDKLMFILENIKELYKL